MGKDGKARMPIPTRPPEVDQMSREERFRATVYAMNTLLVQKGIYSPEEFEFQFRQFAQKTHGA